MKSLLLTCCLFIGGTAYAQQAALISGKIAEPTQDSIKVSYYINLVDFKRHVTTVPVAQNGVFSMRVPLTGPTAAFMEFNYEIIELYLQPGDKLEVRFNTDDVEKTLKFKGQGANENNCLAKLNYNYQEDEDFHYSDKNIYTNDGAYLKLVEEKFDVQQKFVEKYMRKTPVSPAFEKWLTTELRYEGGLQKINYPEIRAAAIKIEDPYKVSRNYYSFLKELPVNDPQNLNSLCYLNYLQELAEYEQLKTSRDKNAITYYRDLYGKAKEILQGEQQAIVLGRIVIESFRKGHIAYSEEILKDYRQLSGAKTYLTAVEANARQNRKLARGSKAPDLKMVDENGKQLNLADLQGKVVYLYFYTMGCGSCQTEIPVAKHLAEKFGNDVAFVFVAVDQDFDTWKRVKQKRGWPGYNGLTVDSAATASVYQLTRFPAMLILDKEGRIADQAAKRLAAPALIDNLQAVVNQKPANPGNVLGALPNTDQAPAPYLPKTAISSRD